MNRVAISAENCKGCRVCVKRCPKKCISMSVNLNKAGYPYAEFKSEVCTACGICYYVCPELGTLTVHEEKQGRHHE
jgi:Pyruvate/2-oxoacid:ferredoxin oxidoreductase delta subunit